MTRSRQAWVLAAVAATCAFAGFLVYQWRGSAPGESAADRGGLLLATTLNGLDDRPQPLEQWRGRVLVVNFWATWCAPCREEIPLFIDFQRKYEARGVQFVGIAVDQKERVVPYARDIGINYPVLVGGMDALDLARSVGNRAGVLPFTLVIDRRGAVSEAFVGIARPDRLEKMLAPLL